MPVPVTIDEHSNYLARLLAIVRLFAAVHESGSGPSRHFPALRNSVAFGAQRTWSRLWLARPWSRMTRSGQSRLPVQPSSPIPQR